MTDPIRILLISGSIRRPSYTHTLTQKIEQALAAHGAVTRLWDLQKKPLPIADPNFHHDPAQHPNKRVRELVALAEATDAFILSSPIYHNSYSGLLKNALDHLAIPHFYYKPVGLCSHGGNRSTQAVDHLRIVVRGLAGFALPSQVCTSSEDYQVVDESSYTLASQEIQARIERSAFEMMAFAHPFRVIRQRVSQGV